MDTYHSQRKDLQISFTSELPIETALPSDLFSCAIGTANFLPLIVKPKEGMTGEALVTWAKNSDNAKKLREAFSEHKALRFDDFMLTSARSHTLFEIITQMPPKEVKSQDQWTERGESFPLHLLGCENPQMMPQYVGFFSNERRGATPLARTQTVHAQLSSLELVQNALTTTVTYTHRYLTPPKTLMQQCTHLLFQVWSHPTVQERFKTDSPQLIEEQCKEDGLTCRWEGHWLITESKEMPTQHQDYYALWRILTFLI